MRNKKVEIINPYKFVNGIKNANFISKNEKYIPQKAQKYIPNNTKKIEYNEVQDKKYNKDIIQYKQDLLLKNNNKIKE